MLLDSLQPGGQDGDVAQGHCGGLGAICEDLLAEVTRVIIRPCFQGKEPEKPFWVVAGAEPGGPMRRAHFLSRPLQTPCTGAGKSQHSPGVASFYL